jgi:hypothetical protein
LVTARSMRQAMDLAGGIGAIATDWSFHRLAAARRLRRIGRTAWRGNGHRGILAP